MTMIKAPSPPHALAPHAALCAAACALFCALLPFASVRADGGFIPGPNDYVSEPWQESLITYDQRSGMECMTLNVSCEGNSRDFAWVIPVPSVPALAPSTLRLFAQCRWLTAPIRHRRDEGFGCWNTSPQDAGAPGGIDIIDDQVVGIYHALTLAADDAHTLADSLETWGYLHDGNRERTEAALRTYIDKSWCFVAMRVDSTAMPLPHDPYWHGELQPLRLTFASAEIVYPLRISEISAAELTEVVLYVSAPHRVSCAGMTAEYANRLSRGEIEEAAEDCPDLAAQLKEGCFLTRLRGVFRPREMREDLVFEPAANDEEFVQIRYSGWTDHGLLPAGLLAAWLLLCGWLRRRRARNA